MDARKLLVDAGIDLAPLKAHLDREAAVAEQRRSDLAQIKSERPAEYEAHAAGVVTTLDLGHVVDLCFAGLGLAEREAIGRAVLREFLAGGR